MVNQARIAINIHQSDWGTNRKIFELIPCTFTLTDRVEGVEDIFGKLTDKMSFATADEAKELIDFYLENEEERNKVLKKEREIIKPLTYKNQISKILEDL
ncbi:MAG: glycosyltransferase [Methanocellales archaeon]|nr:glycosyltransferase [Methanocellales archaeon]